MENLSVGIFHDEELGKELGKKGTESDIKFFNRKTDDFIFTFMQPIDDKIIPKSQIISNIDAAIVSCDSITPKTGETILMLDSMDISNGIIILPEYADIKPIVSITKGTSLESFVIKRRNPDEIFDFLKKIIPKRKKQFSPFIVIDHSFSVRGVGEVVLGFVKMGSIKKHDKLTLFPSGKEISIRSIQMQDKDFDEAVAGSRVGLAIKGATVEEMKRGSIICIPEDVHVSKKINMSFEKCMFYNESLKEGPYHITVGMQTVLVNVCEIKEKSIIIESQKPIVYKKDDIFLLLDLNGKKLRFIGKCRPKS